MKPKPYLTSRLIPQTQTFCPSRLESFHRGSRALRIQSNSIEKMIRRNKERRAIFAPGTIAGGRAQIETAEQRAVRRKRKQSARRGCENVSVHVHFQTVRHTGTAFRGFSAVEENF